MLPRPGAHGPFQSGGLARSFRHALRGVAEVAAHERNMKIHLCAGAAVGLAGSEVAFGLAARLALLLSVALVLAAEVLNSALEALVDLHTHEFRHEARQVKDAAAGVVLLLAAGAALAGTAVLAVSWGEVSEAVARLGLGAAWDIVVVGCVAALLFGRRSRALAAVVALLGAAGVAVIAMRSVSLTFTALATGVLAIAAGARCLTPHPAVRGEGESGAAGGEGRAAVRTMREGGRGGR